MGSTQLAALLIRAGFDIETFNNFEFDLNIPNPENLEEVATVKEKYYSIVAVKARPLDIK